MTTALTAQQAFEAKMMDRIRENIGELIPDAALAEMVKRAMRELFFEERVIKNKGYYRDQDQVIPPLMHDIVKNLLTEEVERQIKVWIENNKSEVIAALNAVITNGVGMAVVSALSNKFSGPLELYRSEINRELEKL